MMVVEQTQEHLSTTRLNTRLKTGSVSTTLTEITHTVTQNTQRGKTPQKIQTFHLYSFNNFSE